jgi:hypothetical protein
MTVDAGMDRLDNMSTIQPRRVLGHLQRRFWSSGPCSGVRAVDLGGAQGWVRITSAI